MEQRNKKSSKRSKTKIIPPKKKRPESLSRDEVRSINKKKIIRKRKAERFAVLSGLALVVLSIGVALVVAIFFKVDKITIKGDKVYADNEVILQSGIETGDSLVLMKEEKINEMLTKKLPYIDKITLDKKLPDSVTITVTATREIVAFQNGAGFVLVDANGKILDDNASILRDNVAIVNGITFNPKTIVEGEKIKLSDVETTESFLALLTAIKESKLQYLTEVTVNEKGDWELRYDDRITVKVAPSDEIGISLKRVFEILTKEDERNPYAEGVLDLTMGKNAYFSPGVETTEPESTDVSGATDENSVTTGEATEKSE